MDSVYNNSPLGWLCSYSSNAIYYRIPEFRQDKHINAFYDGQVQGTYLHGVFDNLEWTRQYLNELRLAKGLEPLEDQLVSIKDFKDREYDKLADVLRQSLDMEQIYQIINREEK